MLVLQSVELQWSQAVVFAAIVIVLLLILAMCTCKHTGSETVTPRVSCRSSKVQDQVVIEVEDEKILRTNGSVPHSSLQETRPVSHERALPAIPVPKDDQQDDDDGHYDVISKAKKSTAANHNHPYEKVTGEDCESPAGAYDPAYDTVITGVGYNSVQQVAPNDPTYSGIKDEEETGAAGLPAAKSKSSKASKTSPQRCPKHHLYAQVNLPPEAEYAQIEDKGASRRHDVTLSGAGLEPPPVPEKHLAEGDIPMMRDLDNIPYADATPSSPVRDISPSPYEAEPTPPAEGSTRNGRRKRDPPYSKVTARESLDALRRREQFSTVTYDQINYELIKSHRQTLPASMFSDVYAEIHDPVVEGSRPSSTYAHIQDVQDGGAPPLPSLQRLREVSSPHTEVRGSRPSSVCSSESDAGYNTVADVDVARSNPVYAKVNKKQLTGHQVYAQVNKNRSKAAGDDASGRSAPLSLPPVALHEVTIEDPDYDTVDGMPTVIIPNNPTPPPGLEGDYESLPNSAVAMVLRNPSPAANTAKTWNNREKREHVYEEIRQEDLANASPRPESQADKGKGSFKFRAL